LKLHGGAIKKKGVLMDMDTSSGVGNPRVLTCTLPPATETCLCAVHLPVCGTNQN
jgi:hypothetical protein